jgi:hypothetical protein
LTTSHIPWALKPLRLIAEVRLCRRRLCRRRFCKSRPRADDRDFLQAQNPVKHESGGCLYGAITNTRTYGAQQRH